MGLLELICVPVGTVVALFFLLFFILSVPVYLFRVIVYVLSKFREDLHHFLAPHSHIIIQDFVNGSKLPASRANIVLSITLGGHQNLEDFTKFFDERMISSGEYKKYYSLKQYPVSWLGFYFWKQDKNFDLSSHIFEVAAGKALPDTIEELLNEPMPRTRSPWDIHLFSDVQNKCVVIFRFHHCLADGNSIFTLLNHLCESMEQGSPSAPILPKTTAHSGIQTIRRVLWAPITIIHFFVNMIYYDVLYSPWKVPDNKKEWHQVTAVSNIIQFETLRRIRRKFNVSIHSIILYCLSECIKENLIEKGKPIPEFMACNVILPNHATAQRAARALTNILTVAIIRLSINSTLSPAEKLKQIHETLTAERDSISPDFLSYYFTLLGNHFGFVSESLFYNRVISTALSNFAGPANKFSMNGSPLLDADFRVGMCPGVIGGGILALTFNKQLRVAVVAERSLMSRHEAEIFVNRITEQITLLDSIPAPTPRA